MEGYQGWTALHLACSLGLQDIAQLMLNGLTFDYNDPQYEATSLFNGTSNLGTVLTSSIASGCIPIVFQTLETYIYFPRLSTRVDPYCSINGGTESARRFLSEFVDGEIKDGKSDEINEHGGAILY